MQAPYLEIHQTRSTEPTVYENLLGDALERAYAAGVADLPGLVDQLTRSGVPAPDGRDWTTALLETELRRLGA